MDSKSNVNLRILMFPWLAYGHISPFLELAKKLSYRNINVYLCSTPINLSFIKERITEEQSDSIHLVDYVLPSLPELPPRFQTTNGLPPHLFPTLVRAFDAASPCFSDILADLKPDLVIYDSLQSWAADVSSSHNIPAIVFLTISAAIGCLVSHVQNRADQEFPFPEIFQGELRRLKDRQESDSTAGRFFEALEKSHKIMLIKSCAEIEKKYMDHLSAISEKKMVPVGTLVQDPVIKEGEHVEIMQWLDKKEESSVVFISFGSEYYLSKQVLEEIAEGLEMSQVNFIWVIRFALGEKLSLEEALPKGYMERAGNRGLILEGWAPQARILQHSSTGGFVSHCGWSSVTESMKFGVPIIAMPMHVDQPLNAKLVEAVGVGVQVARDHSGEYKREEIAKTISKVVMEESGNGVRSKARNLSEDLRIKGDEEIDGLVEELLAL